MRIRILFLIMLSVFFVSSAYSQGTFKANADNFFVTPKTSAYSYHDILANDYYGDDALLSELEITIVQASVKGTSNWDAASSRIRYRIKPPLATNVGLDSLIYQIKAPNGKIATATAYFHINDKPDVISDADCFVEPDPLLWGIKEIVRSDESKGYISTGSNILTGDIDGDGKTEMFVYSADSTVLAVGHKGASNKILVLRYNENGGTPSLDVEYKIDLPGFQFQYVYGNFAIGNVDDDGYGSVFVAFLGVNSVINQATGDVPLLIKYKFTPGVGGSKGRFVEEWRQQYTTLAGYRNVTPVITDIMGDGHKQISILNKIYDAKTGILLVDGDKCTPAITQSTAFSFGRFGHAGLTYQAYLATGDIDGDGIMELIGGDCVYKVSITEYNSSNNPTSVNTMSLLRRADATGRVGVTDGGTALVDIDGDGLLDVVVTGKVTSPLAGSLYAYNPRTGDLLHTNDVTDIARNNTNGPSMPFVGDLDGDGQSEIALTSYMTLRAYKYNPISKTIDLMWHLPTTDSSAATTLSIFDFAQDGKGRLIYRDETDLRIIDGRKYGDDGITLINDADRVLATFAGVNSPTVNEYPIVADVTGDGFAEILAVGGNIRTTNDFRGSLRLYGPVNGHWAPARSVWNQIAYNPVYVNDDLTIPSNPVSPSSVFYGVDASGNTTQSRPFNNFLQQATTLNKSGEMTMDGPDLAFTALYPRKISFNDDGSVTVTVTVQNIGIASFSEAIEVQLYSSLSTTAPVTYTAVGSANVDSNVSGLPAGGVRSYTYSIPSSQVPADGSFDGWAVTVNLSTGPGASIPVYKHGKECHEGYNNRALGFSVVDGVGVACQGGNGLVVANPSGVYDIDWYTTGGILLRSKSDTCTLINKNSDAISKLILRVYKKGTLNLASTIPDTAYVYRAADSLVWTNAVGNRDWNEPGNWSNPSDLSGIYAQGNVPRGCTNIILPGGVSGNYPDLKSLSQSGGHTDYSQYARAECNNITFGFGSGLSRPDLLDYSRAYVKADLTAHRWYGFSSPLKNLYTGDFYIDDPAPGLDIIESYTKLWGATDPRWGGYFESAWTSMFPDPDIELTAGKGLGVWISRKDNTEGFDEFSFPKHNTEFNVYFPDGSINEYYPTMTVDRSDKHRFVFDGQGVNGSNFPLNIESKESGSLVMVGNPFMSHLDFDAFYAANSGKIKPIYRILDKLNNTYLYYKQGQAGDLSKNIAPMQAFFVEALVPFTSLTINGTMTNTQTGSGSTLKSSKSGEGSSSDIIVPITVSQGLSSGKSYLVFGDSYVSGYDSQSDVLCLMSKSSDKSDMGIGGIGVYSVLGNDYLSLNTQPKSVLSASDYILPLGIRTSSKSAVRVNVGNLSGLPSEADWSLYDSKFNMNYPLKSQSMYTFTDIVPDGNYMVNNRFYLRSSNLTTSIDNDTSNDTPVVQLNCSSNHLSVESSKDLQDVRVYNLQGSLLNRVSSVSTTYSVVLPYSAVYIVRVQTDGGVKSYRVLNR